MLPPCLDTTVRFLESRTDNTSSLAHVHLAPVLKDIQMPVSPLPHRPQQALVSLLHLVLGWDTLHLPILHLGNP